MNFFSRKRAPESEEAAPAPVPTPLVDPATTQESVEGNTPVDVDGEPGGSKLEAEYPDTAAAEREVEEDEFKAQEADEILAVAFPEESSVDEVPVGGDAEAAPAMESGPPRALFAGSFLGGEFEIKEVLLRGHFNFYLADAGDYGSHDWKLVGERVAVGEDPVDGPEDSFFPSAHRFMQEGREYAVWDFQNLKPLDEWNAHPNDETYLHVLGSLAHGFSALEGAGLKPDLPREGLFIDASGRLKAFTFFDAHNDAAFGMTAIEQLAALSSRFAKTNLAAGATLRLDDEFGSLPFSEEVKGFARSLADGEFSSPADAVAALDKWTPFSTTEAALLTDVGMERELNEDCGMLWKSSRAGHSRNFELELLAVSDGMGGHEGGEVASDLTLSSLESALVKRLGMDVSDNATVLGAMAEILVEVNSAVVSLTENPPYASMRNKPGATLVCALRVGSRVFIGNVGDSRTYRWNAQNGLERLTVDHSYVQELVDKGAISEDEAWGHPDGSIITSHIGMLRGLKRDVFLRILSQGDRLVLVSDGVVDTLRDIEIEQIVAEHDNARELCAALVDAANEAGGIDNITVAALICR